MNIYLIAGHHNKDSGATALHKSTGSIKENELTIELRNLVKSYLQYENIITDNDNSSLITVINEVNKKITANDILLDIHFNSFYKPSTTGVEVIALTNTNELGQELVDKLSEIMNIPNRGVKLPSDTARGSIGILKGKGNRVLLEVCFISNLNDITQYIKHKHLIALTIAETLDKYAKKNIRLV